MREAPSIVLAGRLATEGADVRGWDPVAEPSELLPTVTIAETPLEAARDADAVVVVTEWPQLRELDLGALHATMRTPLVIDGRNFLEPATVRAAGLVYEGIGRAASPFAGLPETAEPEQRQPAS
jgi:UDPglucose 6-dehydrogenase